MKNLFKNRTVVGISAITLSLIISFGITPLFNNALQAKTKVVRITKDVAKGEEITSDKVQIAEVGGYNLPKEVLKNKENVVGKYATADLFKGDYVLNTKVSESPTPENKYLYGLDGNKQAISITIKSFAAGLSGKLQNGDIVSIIASDYGDQRQTLVPKELQYVKVLAVTTSKGADRQDDVKKSSDDEQELPSAVTLLVDRTQAKLLAELETKSKIHLSLVYRGSETNAQKFSDVQDKVLKETSGDSSAVNQANTVQQP
ncbi:Flp pilus assembly protein CpaB [Clostridiales bacterium oral taxon 876 str. F0540]|nr:Flp pilus assembly protein CpaB [Clostridiales bacterium oral taxon 876 str. F0540]